MQMKDGKHYMFEEAWICSKTGSLNVVTKHQAGCVLSEYLKRTKDIQVSQAQSFMRQLVDALEFFHSNGITLGTVSCDKILKSNDQLFLIAKNQRIQSSTDPDSAYILPFLEEEADVGTI